MPDQHEQPYDPSSACRKCGHACVTTEHIHLAFTYLSRIRRECCRCHYTWDQLPLDHDWDTEKAMLEARAEEHRIRKLPEEEREQAIAAWHKTHP